MNQSPPKPPASAETGPLPAVPPVTEVDGETAAKPAPVREIGGRRDGTEPTRFGDWEKGGRCIDF